MSDTIKSTWSLRKFFEEARRDPIYHMGLGDIRLTIGMQEELCRLVEGTAPEPPAEEVK